MKNKKSYIYIGLPILGILFYLAYLKRSAIDMVYSDYIRLINSYLPDVWNPDKFFVADLLTRIPVNFLERGLNVMIFGYSVTVDRVMGVLGFGLSALVIGWYSRKKELCPVWYAAMMIVMFSLNKWEMLYNGTGWAHVLAFGLFFGAFDLSASWSQEGVKGCRRFLERVWKLQDSLVDGDSYSKELESKMHQTIKKVSSDYESLKYNTAIAAMMTLVNEIYKAGKVTRKEFETLLILLNPVAPHMTEELWADLGYEGRLYQTAWPEFDEEKTVEAVAEIAVQINGKMRGTIKIAKDADKETAIAAAKEAVADKLTGNIVKEIYVPGRIVNIVQK